MGKVVFNIVETDYDVFIQIYVGILFCFRLYLKDQHHHYNISKLNRRILKMNKEEINELTAKIEACWDENNPGDVESFDERLKQKLTPEEYELITSWR